VSNHYIINQQHPFAGAPQKIRDNLVVINPTVPKQRTMHNFLMFLKDFSEQDSDEYMSKPGVDYRFRANETGAAKAWAFQD